MSTPTSKLGISKPSGNETVSRSTFNAIYDQIDAAAASQADLDTLKSTAATKVQLDAHTTRTDNPHNTTATQVSLNSSNFTSTNVKAGMDELFTNVSNGKTTVAAAITGKGVAASGNDTFAQLASKVSSIQLATGNAGTGDVLVGKTFSNATTTGATGTMSNYGNVALATPTTSNQYLSAGYYGSGSYVKGDPNLNTSNIRAGATIFGVPGDAWTVWTGDCENNDSAVLAGNRYWAYGTKRTGTMPNRSDGWQLSASTTMSGQYALMLPPAGYYNQSVYVQSYQPDITPSNIVTGKNIFGIVGTAYTTNRGEIGNTLSNSSGQVQFTITMGSSIKSYYLGLYNSNDVFNSQYVLGFFNNEGDYYSGQSYAGNLHSVGLSNGNNTVTVIFKGLGSNTNYRCHWMIIT